MKRLVGVALLLGLALATCFGGCGGAGETDSADSSSSTSVTTGPRTVTTVEPTGPPTHWQKLTPANEPHARERHVMVYDPITEKVLLFGGHYSPGGPGFESLNDLWAYDSSTNVWTELHPNGEVPSARGGRGMVFDPGINMILWVGAPASSSASGDQTETWAYDPAANAWKELHPTGDIPPGGGLMVYDAASSSTLLLHEVEGFEIFWSYDSSANSWSRLGYSEMASVEAMAYDTNRGSVVVYSPVGIGWRSTLWDYDSQANKAAVLDPGGVTVVSRWSPAMVYHPGSGLMLLFGGENYGEDMNSLSYPLTLMAYDSVTNTWAKLDYVDRTPYGRAGHAMVYDPKTGKIIMFGGRNEVHGYHSGTWILTP